MNRRAGQIEFSIIFDGFKVSRLDHFLIIDAIYRFHDIEIIFELVVFIYIESKHQFSCLKATSVRYYSNCRIIRMS